MRRPVTPSGSFSVAQALKANPTLGALLGQWAQAQQCLTIVKPLLGPSLGRLVRAGPLQDGTWTLLTDSGAAAAKLRQLLPRLLQALKTRALPVSAIEIKVSPVQTP